MSPSPAERAGEPSGPRVAIVGAGPSGLFAAMALLDGDADVRVDVLDRLPTPFGLLRYGVAPDHTSVKAIQRVLAAPFASERVRFFGMVDLGETITAEELRAGYDAVIYAVGASAERRLGVRGEDLPGSVSARDFVAWYSGHPDASPPPLEGVTTAVAFGVGNVALDVARMLLSDPERLTVTDMPEDVLALLGAHRVREVVVVGRRGPQHASFTPTELRGLLALEGIQPVIEGGDLPAADDPAVVAADRRVRWNLEALREAQDRVVDEPRAVLRFLFWRRPIEIVGSARVRAVVLERTSLDEAGAVIGTAGREVLSAQLVLRAIGYRAVPLAGVPFDEAAGIVPNRDGRVVDADGSVRPREYVVGWIKRGPVGVIGTNKADARATVAHVLADLAADPHRVRSQDVAEVLAARGVRPSNLADWERIDAAEIARGEQRSRARTKVATWHELVDLVRFGRGGGPLEHEHETGVGDG